MNLFDSFFRLAPSTEAVLSLVPALTPSIADVDNGQIAERYTTCGVAERFFSTNYEQLTQNSHVVFVFLQAPCRVQ